MRSIQVKNVTPDTQADYSGLMVCRSAAGRFVGTRYKDGSPGSRDTCYFHSENDADFALKLIERMYAKISAMRAKAQKLGVDHSDLLDEEFSSDVAAVLLMCGLDQHEVGYRLTP